MKEVEAVEQKLKRLSQLKQDLAEYFCEDESKFKLEDLLLIFKTFCNHLDKAKEVGFNDRFRSRKSHRKHLALA